MWVELRQAAIVLSRISQTAMIGSHEMSFWTEKSIQSASQKIDCQVQMASL
jgi:hypothetical protein